MQLLRLRRSLLIATALGLGATGVLAGTVQAATSPGTVTLPSSPGSNKVTFHGTAPFNNGQANLLLDDVTGACDPNNGMGAQFRDATDVTVKVPQHVNPAYDVFIRFQIDWSSVTTETTEDLRLDLFGPDGKLVASSDSSQEQEGINVTAPVGGKYKMVVCAFQDFPNGQDYTGTVTASLLRPPPHPQATNVTTPASSSISLRRVSRTTQASRRSATTGRPARRCSRRTPTSTPSTSRTTWASLTGSSSTTTRSIPPTRSASTRSASPTRSWAGRS